MKQLSLFPGAAPSTMLGFGTTSLMGLPSSKERLALLNTAFDAGLRHYDTAPYYGYGEAERILGAFVEGKRDQLTITTKYGIQPPALVKARWVNVLARRVLCWLPSLKAALSRQAQALTIRAPFSALAARQSLDQSLVALRTDHVDLFLLHEPTYTDAASEEINQFLEEEVRRGRIRAFGCGGEFEVIQKVARARLPTSRWLQFEDNILHRRLEEIRVSGARAITFRIFHQALPRLSQWLEAGPGRYAEWQRQLQIDLRAEGALAGLLQAAAHARNPDGIVLFSTRRAERIRSSVQIASGKEFSEEQLGKFEVLTKSVGALP